MGRFSWWGALAGAAALVAATAAFPSVSHAIVFNLDSDHCSGGCGPAGTIFGTVTVTQNGTTVDFVVDLANSFEFAKTGAGDFQAFKFNATGVVVGDITVNQNNPGETLAATNGSLNGDGTGPFSFGIACTTCGNGLSDGFSTDIIFHVANATIADLTAANTSGIVFVADIGNPETGATGPVAATHSVAVPGPMVGAGVPGLIAAALGMLGWWRRKRKAEAAA